MSAERPHPLRRWLIAVTLTAIVLVLGAFGALQYALARMPEYQARLQAFVRERTGLTIDFRRVDASLRWYGPEVVFWGAVLRAPDNQVLASARRGAVSLAWGRSLLERRAVIGRISLDGPELGIVRTPAGKFKVIGFESEDEDRAPDLARLPEGRYLIRDARVRFVDEQHARQPWVLSKVALDVLRSSDTLLVEGSSDLPEALGRDLDFDVRITGDLKRAQSWQTEVRVDADSLQLARWRESMAPDVMDVLQGVASLQLRGRWQGAALQDLKAKIQASDVALSVPKWRVPIPGAAPLVIKYVDENGNPQSPAEPAALPAKDLATRVSYDRVRASVELRRMRKEWRAQVDELDLGKADGAIRPSRLEASWTQADGGALDSLWLKTDHLALEPLWPLLGWLRESESLARLRALEAGGALDDVDVFYQRRDTGPTYRVRTKLSQLKFAPVGRVPGVAGLTATLDANEQGGRLKLLRAPLAFSWPSTFRNTLPLDRLMGEVRWRRTAAGWQIDSNRLQLANHDGRAEAQLQLTIPHDGASPQIELTADAYDLDVRATSRYLPANHLSDKSLDWLDRAFVAGHVPHATVHLSGALRQFPFRDGGGEFIARADVKDLTLDYQPQWMPATEVRASVEFRNAGMRGELQSGRIGGLELERGEARFADFKDAILTLKGNAHGDLDQALRYLQTSPLGPSMGSPFMGLAGRGSGAYAVDLSLPLKNLPARHVDVQVRLANASLDHDAIKKPLARLNGSLRIVNTQLYSGVLRGQWLGGPVLVGIEPQGQRSIVSAKGTLLANELGGLLRLPSSVHLLGESAWSGYAQLGPRKAISGTAAHVTVEMDGTSVALPEPLRKDPHDRRPLSADLELDESYALVRATFGSVRAVGRIAETERGWRFDRAGVRADGASPSVPAHEGVRLEGHLDTFILDDWLALQAPQSIDALPKNGLKVSDVLRAANLDIGEFGLLGYRWRDVRGLMQAGERSWRVDVSAPQVAGHLDIPYDFASGDVLTADLERLVVPQRATSAGDADPQNATDPRKLPTLRAHVRDFAYQDHGMGEFTLQWTRVPQGVRIDQAEVRGSSYEGEANGSWLVTPAGQLTSMNVLIASSDVRDTLTTFNYSPFMRAKHAEVKGNLSWPGGFDDKWLARAAGKLSVHVEQGQLLKVEPGAGRVLGLFSFSALPRRLSLDFTDLTGEGLTFDKIHGDFDLHDGNAYTTNLVVSGPATEIGLAGRTGLEAHDYDQTVVVTGKLGVSPAVAGALAGGPAVAAAVLLFSQIFKEPLKGVTRGYYRITGTWEEPIVERVHGAQGKEAAESSRIQRPTGTDPS